MELLVVCFLCKHQWHFNWHRIIIYEFSFISVDFSSLKGGSNPAQSYLAWLVLSRVQTR